MWLLITDPRNIIGEVLNASFLEAFGHSEELKLETVLLNLVKFKSIFIHFC